MLIYTTAHSDQDLAGILELQKKNLPTYLPREEIDSQGFVTVNHSPGELQQLHAIEPSLIVKDGDKIVGYALAMTEASKTIIPVLVPMFDIFNNIMYKGKAISSYRYIVVGQVCIDKAYRGQGVFDDCYKAYKATFGSKYDFAITEISTKNKRSLNAHQRAGFRSIHTYAVPGGDEWDIVLWAW